MTSLERSYRRLLACYPKDHRALHEEEMIAVLLAGAAPGQKRPGGRDAFDLLRGSLSIRLRRAGESKRRHWRDAVDIAALIAPIALCLAGLFRAGRYVARATQGPFVREEVLQALEPVAYALPYGLIALLAWLGRRKAAIACAWAWAVVSASITLGKHLDLAPGMPVEIVGIGLGALPFCVCAAMLTFAPSPGPAPLGTPRLLGWTAAVLATLVAGTWLSFGWVHLLPFLVAVAAAVTALRSPVGRRAMVALLPLLSLSFPRPWAGDLANLATLTTLSITILAVTAWLARAGTTASRPAGG